MPTPDRTAHTTISAADYAAALKLVARSGWKRPLPLLAIAFFAVLLIVIVVTGPGSNSALTSIALGAVIGLLLLPFIVYWLLLPWRARTIYRQQKSLHDPVTIAWDEAGYTARNAHVGGTLPWTHYFDWLEDSAIIVIRQSPALFQMLPKSALTAAQADDMRACARAARLKGA